MLGASFRTGIAPLIVIALTIPVVVAFTLVLVGAVDHAGHRARWSSRRRFPALERRHGGSWWLSLVGVARPAPSAALLVVVVTLPFWLVPGLALVLPPLIWGWLTARVMGFDALAEHAAAPEREAHPARAPLAAAGHGRRLRLPVRRAVDDLDAEHAGACIFAPLHHGRRRSGSTR